MSLRQSLTRLQHAVLSSPPDPDSLLARYRALTDAQHHRLGAIDGELSILAVRGIRLVLNAVDAGATPPWSDHDRLAVRVDELARESTAIFNCSDAPDPDPGELDALLQPYGLTRRDVQRYEAALAGRAS